MDVMWSKTSDEVSGRTYEQLVSEREESHQDSTLAKLHYWGKGVQKYRMTRDLSEFQMWSRGSWIDVTAPSFCASLVS